MLRKISELDFDDVIARIQRSVNPVTRKIGEPVFQGDIDSLRSPADAIEMVRDHIAIAILDLDQVTSRHPLVHALVRCQHHPDARPIPVAGPLTAEVAERLNELVAAHPELGWNPDTVQKLLVQAIGLHGEHELDDEQRPGLMYWGPASSAATALIALVALRELGDL